MPKKPKFNPQIARGKLNPEQAVLACTCHTGRLRDGYSVPMDYANHVDYGMCESFGGKSYGIYAFFCEGGFFSPGMGPGYAFTDGVGSS
jgi:hypothetical protein